MRQKNLELSKKKLIGLQEKKQRQNRSLEMSKAKITNQWKASLLHKMMEIKRIQLMAMLHLQILLKMRNQTKKMLMKNLQHINFIKSSLLSSKLTNKTQKMSLSL